jgi:anti-sigma28 factor (negative regulator of flagellin synthesis)
LGTYVDGIGASQNIDSSGEIVDIAGLDISSLEVDGSLNWEHKKDVPDQLVGKILKAKKIFSVKDCEDDRQKYYWEKCKVPYLYVLGELFDDYTDSARTVAGLFRYDLDHRGKNAKDIVGFSVEGATIHKAGNTITRSIARKITCTGLPCNKMAVAEMVPKEGSKPKDNLSNIFKTESYVEIEVVNLPKESNLWEMLKAESLMKRARALFGKPMKKDVQAMTSGAGTSMALGGTSPTSPSLSCSEPDMGRSEAATDPNLMKANPPKLAVAKPNPLGTHLGNTTSGKPVHSHAMVGETGFNHQEHAEAAALHQKAGAANPKMAQHHAGKVSLHNSASITLKDRAIKHAAAAKNRPGSAMAPASPKSGKLHDPRLSGTVSYKKSETLQPGEQGNEVAANQKQQRARRAQEAYPNNDKRHWDKHKVNHSESNPQNVKRASIPNKQVLHPVPAAGQPKNNMLHNNLLAPKETMHKAGGGGGGIGGGGPASGGSFNIGVTEAPSVPNPKPKTVMPVGKITKALEAGSSLTSPANLSGGAALGKESLEKDSKDPTWRPKDMKIKQLQSQIDSGTYKPDAKAIAGKMLEHKDKPLKKLEVLQKPYVSEAQRRWAHTDSGMEALGGKAGVHEWDEATKGKKLPERKPMKKSEALQRAEAEYASWEKREEFEQFMKSRMPHMTKGEIVAFGQAMLLNKSTRMEKSLNGLLGLLREDKK